MKVLYLGAWIFSVSFLGSFLLISLIEQFEEPPKPPTTYTVVTEYGTYTGIRHKPYVGYVNESGKRHNFHGSYTMVEE